MSLYKDASLAMIPSAYKDGKLYSIRPTDGSGDFTFSRGSNLAATRVDVNGYIEKGRENLLLQSNQFDTTWVPTGINITSGQSGYDGSNNAWLLEVNATGTYRRITQSTGGSLNITNSIYAKAGTANFIVCSDVGGGGTTNVWFNLSNGTIGTIFGSNVIDAKIESVGGGWYRCSVAHQGEAPNYALWFIADSNNTTAGTAGANVYIQDAQQEVGLVATDYIETGASTAQAGILEDMPRLDYSGSCPSLLLEPQRSNLITNSEYLNGFSNKSAISVTSNAAISPDGLQNASKLIPDTSNVSTHYIRQDVSVSSGTQYVISFFAKKGEYNYVNTYTSAYSTGSSATWDLNAGVVSLGSPNADIEDYGNGWYRCIWKGTTNTTSLSYRIYVSEFEDRNTSFAGDGVKGAYVYGASIEQGSYPTSYIPTYGSSVTRSNDNMGTTFSSPLTSGGEVSVLFDIDGAYNSDLNSTGDNLAFIFSDDDRIIYNQNSNGYHRIEMNVAGRTELIYRVTSVDRVDRAKICIVVTASTYAMYVNGSLEDSGSFTGTGNWTSADSFSNSMTEAIGVVPMQQLLYFPTALTSSEAIALTTL